MATLSPSSDTTTRTNALVDPWTLGVPNEVLSLIFEWFVEDDFDLENLTDNILSTSGRGPRALMRVCRGWAEFVLDKSVKRLWRNISIRLTRVNKDTISRLRWWVALIQKHDVRGLRLYVSSGGKDGAYEHIIEVVTELLPVLDRCESIALRLSERDAVVFSSPLQPFDATSLTALRIRLSPSPFSPEQMMRSLYLTTDDQGPGCIGFRRPLEILSLAPYAPQNLSLVETNLVFLLFWSQLPLHPIQHFTELELEGQRYHKRLCARTYLETIGRMHRLRSCSIYLRPCDATCWHSERPLPLITLPHLTELHVRSMDRDYWEMTENAKYFWDTLHLPNLQTLTFSASDAPAVLDMFHRSGSATTITELAVEDIVDIAGASVASVISACVNLPRVTLSPHPAIGRMAESLIAPLLYSAARVNTLLIEIRLCCADADVEYHLAWPPQAKDTQREAEFDRLLEGWDEYRACVKKPDGGNLSRFRQLAEENKVCRTCGRDCHDYVLRRKREA